MDKKFSFGKSLDFNDIDLTAPDKVIENILPRIPEETNHIIMGKIQLYSGHTFSYKKADFSGGKKAAGPAEKAADIQSNLGETGQEVHKFECFLYTPEYDSYRYRIFLLKYDIAHYPVDVILDESIAGSIRDENPGYVHTCGTREELEALVYTVFNSKRVVAVMQKLIRIHQIKKAEKNELGTNGIIDVK